MTNKNRNNEFVSKFIFFFRNKRKHVRVRICEKLKENKENEREYKKYFNKFIYYLLYLILCFIISFMSTITYS